MDDGAVRSYHTVLLEPQPGWVLLILPNDLVGTARRIWIRGTINGKSFQATANPWRESTHVVMMNKKLRAELGVGAGTAVHVEFEVCERPAEPPPPADVTAMLDASPEAADAFAALPPSHRKEHLDHIDAAKRPETRARRIERMIVALSEENAQ